jgi:hypothetical protein
VKIQLTFAESPDPLEELLGGRLMLTEVLEGRQEFLEELVSRLNTITSPREASAASSELDTESTIPLRWNRRTAEETPGADTFADPFADPVASEEDRIS